MPEALEIIHGVYPRHQAQILLEAPSLAAIIGMTIKDLTRIGMVWEILICHIHQAIIYGTVVMISH